MTNRILSDLEKLGQNDSAAYDKIWETFGAVLKEGLYEDFERRPQLLGLARFKTTASGGGWRTLKDYAGALKENQTAIYYMVGDDLARLEVSPQLEGFQARGIEVLLLPDQIDSFWVTAGINYQGKPFKSVIQGAADLKLIPLLASEAAENADTTEPVSRFITFAKTILGDEVSDVRASDRLTTSAVCLVAAESGMDRQLEKLLANAGRISSAAKPILEINPRHQIVTALAGLGEADQSFREDATRLLLDEARILDGERPNDAKAFSERLTRVLGRGLT